MVQFCPECSNLLRKKKEDGKYRGYRYERVDGNLFGPDYASSHVFCPAPQYVVNG